MVRQNRSQFKPDLIVAHRCWSHVGDGDLTPAKQTKLVKGKGKGTESRLDLLRLIGA
uniref:Uncharacterized protein n=1 Tax=Solanum tuberosum TaxID=4113 RepID=M1A2M8_SOLTU